MIESILGNAKVVANILALGPVGYILLAILSAGALYMAWMAKKNAHNKAVEEATNSASEATQEAQDRLEDTNSAGDSFLDD